MYDYSKLIGRIIEIFGTQGKFAREMGLSERSVSLKLNNKKMFKQSEIQLAICILSLTEDDIPDYFFKKKVQCY